MENKTTDGLSSSFVAPVLDEWVKVASAETGGEAPMEKLSWKLADLEFLPIYNQQHLNQTKPGYAFVLGNESRPRAWANMPLIRAGNEEAANANALQQLKNEAEGILFQLDPGKTDFRKLLNGIAWEHCTVSFAGDAFPSELANMMVQRFDPHKLSGAYFSSDHKETPLFRTGFKMLGVIVTPSNAVDELAAGLIQGTQLIEKFTAKGYHLDESIRHIAFQLPLGPELLTEIAKLKAIRQLWYQVVRAFGIKNFHPDDLYLHGFSDKWINAKYQPHGNMLKSTIASIAGISGGCNALTVVPEDSDNTVMNRIARNTSHILLEESHLGKVNDPFAGAYALEVMTNEIATAAWKKFQAMV